ncbi:hypothetical protein [Catenibacterium sp.]|uniref:hypothetical protein n=1 Tax=Catenibacterium sp. TaxID=2049022 RepID=UPI002E762113|nr:hypothetical protein [Catenibacterium sp.]MEE0042601.1 hypothetical protein [Catenibacterium sp.]
MLGIVGFKVKPFKYSKNFFYSSEALAFKSVVVAVLVSCLLLKEELSLNIIAPFLPLLITVYKSLANIRALPIASLGLEFIEGILAISPS